MKSDAFVQLAKNLEQGDGGSSVLSAEIVEALSFAFPACIQGAGPGAEILHSTEVALRVVDGAVPSWVISLTGVAVQSDGQWHCTLREGSAADDDAVVGFGQAPSLPRSMIAALLRVAAVRAGS